MRGILLSCVVLTLVAGTAFGQGAAMSEQGRMMTGEKEIGFAVTFMQPAQNDLGGYWMAVGNFGYFLTANIQLKGLAMVFGSMSADAAQGAAQGDADSIYGTVGGACDYLFGRSIELAPYAGAGILAGLGDLDSAVMLDVHGGLKQFINDSTSINYELKYMAGVSDADAGMLVATVGLNFYYQ